MIIPGTFDFPGTFGLSSTPEHLNTSENRAIVVILL
jgi:hypothetical protein